MWNLIRWVSPRTIKETFVPPRDYRYPFMAPTPTADSGGTGRLRRIVLSAAGSDGSPSASRGLDVAIAVFFDHLSARGALRRHRGRGRRSTAIRRPAPVDRRAWRTSSPTRTRTENVPFRSVYGRVPRGRRRQRAHRQRVARHAVAALVLLEAPDPVGAYTTLDRLAGRAGHRRHDRSAALFGFALTQDVLPSLTSCPPAELRLRLAVPAPAPAAGVSITLARSRSASASSRPSATSAPSRRASARRSTVLRRPQALPPARRSLADGRLDVPRSRRPAAFLRAFHDRGDRAQRASSPRSARACPRSLPLSPGGIGTEQALLVVVLAAPTASRSARCSR